MPDEKKPAASAAKEEASGETYPVDRLILESDDRFGVPSHVAAGAFSGSPKEELTIAEGEKLIADYSKHEVEVDNPIPTAEEVEV